MALKKFDTSKKPEVAKAPTQKLSGTDENAKLIIKLLLDTYIVCGNMTYVYDLYRRVIMGRDYEQISSINSSAKAWFAKPENQEYIEIRRKEIDRKGFDNYCRIMGIEHKDFKEQEQKTYDNLSGLTPAQIREKNYAELEMLKDKTEDPQVKAGIIKQQSELMDAKLKDKNVEVSDTDKFIHYFLPSPYCDDCPSRCKLEAKFDHLPDIDLTEKQPDHDEA